MSTAANLARRAHRWAVRARVAHPARLVVAQRRSPAVAAAGHDHRTWSTTLRWDEACAKERMAIAVIDRYLDEHPRVGVLEVVTTARALLRHDDGSTPSRANVAAHRCEQAHQRWAAAGVEVRTRRGGSEVDALAARLAPAPPAVAPDALVVASDASYDPLRRVGAWSWASEDRTAAGQVPRRLVSSFDCELFALVQAVRAHPGDEPLVVLCDCRTVIDGARHVAATGTAPTAVNQSAQRVRHLWRDLVELTAARNIGFEWVKGHAGHPLQTLPDIASRRMMRRLAAAA